jgi:hypothetical protein
MAAIPSLDGTVKADVDDLTPSTPCCPRLDRREMPRSANDDAGMGRPCRAGPVRCMPSSHLRSPRQGLLRRPSANP